MARINESSINHNAILLIDGIVSDFIELEQSGNCLNERELAMIDIGYIKGVCDMADTLKQVLRI